MHSCRSFSFTDVKLKKTKPKQSIVPYKIPSLIFRDCATLLVPRVFFLYNLWFQNCTSADILKQFSVAPIHKKDKTSLIANYRPIFVFYNFSKALQITLYEPVHNHIRHMLIER